MKHSRLRWSAGSIALVCLAIALPTTAGAQIFGSDPESLKRTDKLIKGAEDLIKETVTARQEIDKTLASYNALFEEDVTDVRKAYKDVEKGIERTEKQREGVRKKVDEMTVEADSYFASWNQSLQQIGDEGLRKRSEDRMKETKAQFDGILSAVDKARGEYEPFIASLKDQWTYLGHDLNASGIASLKPDADKLNTQAGELFKSIDEGMKKAEDYIASLRSSKPVS
ncbi:MAG: DUF2959 family protein [Vicinamibacteria bacterium]